MSEWLKLRHKRLQLRLQSEMQRTSDRAAQEASAAVGADRSQTARANKVRDLRQEAERGTAADGADFSTEEIPSHMLLRFKKIPKTDGGFTPAWEKMTDQEKDFMGENMGLEIDKWNSLVKTPCLMLPQTVICKHWMD